MADRGGRLEVALIGYGLAGSVFHAPLIDAVDDLHLAAVVTGSPERAADARARYPGVRILADAKEIWHAADRYDLVVVASPNRTHVPLALDAVGAGLAVVVDKPVAARAADARALRAAAARREVPVAVYQNRRFDGDLLTVMRLLAEHALGEVHRFESRFERLRPVVDPHAWRERADPAEAGGVLFDLGSHLVDQALVLFGPVERVYAELRHVRPGARVDDDAFVALGHRGGVHSALTVSLCAADFGPRLRVLGSRASLAKFGPDGQEALLRAGGSPRDPGYGLEPAANRCVLETPDARELVPLERGAYQRFYVELAEALRSGGPVPISLDDAITTLEVLEAARTSALEERVVRLGS